MAKQLSVKQEQFAHYYVETGNAAEAYRRAYNAENMKPATIVRKAHDVFQNGNVAALIDKLKAEHRERHNMTVDDIIRELEEARQIALADNKAAPMVSATMGKAKVLGLIIDKQEIKTLEPPKIVVELTSGE